MTKLIFLTIALLLGLASTAYAGDASTGCNALCWRAHHPQSAKPSVSDETCIYFVQPSEDTVVLTLDLKAGDTRTYSRVKGPTDSFCIRRSWTAESSRVSLCNKTTGNAYYVGPDLEALSVKPQYSQTLVACLYGKDKCAAMGYKVAP